MSPEVADIDILIVGGGPAGLMAATYLSERHHVLLIERGTLGETAKCWVTTERRLRKHRLDQCALSKPPTMMAGTFLGGHVSVAGDFAVVDDCHVLQVLLERCRSRGVRLIENCSLLNLSWTKQHVQAQTSDGTLSARLVVDATGGLSPVASTFRLNRIYGFYSVYGALLQNIKLHTPQIVLGYVNQLGHPPPVLELFPTGDDSAYCVIFVYSQALVAPQTLAASFDDHCRNNPFFEMTAKTRSAAPKAGAIPIGRRRHRNLPGVVPFGEAGLIQPPLMGTAFNEVLEHSEALCLQLTKALDDSDQSPPSIRLTYPLLKKSQDRLQLPLVRNIVDGNLESFDKILRVMSRFPEHLLYNFFANELNWTQVFRLAFGLPFYFVLDAASFSHDQSRVLRKTQPN